MGLHRHIRHSEMNPIEDETRRRLFFVISQVDGYVSCILGFPILLRDEDVDQPMPTEVDDEYITKDGVLKPPSGTPSFFQAFNAHVRLIALLKKVIRHVYPSKGVEQCVLNGERPGATYLISFDKIQEIEGDLQKWYSDLPHYWRHSSDGPTEVIRFVIWHCHRLTNQAIASTGPDCQVDTGFEHFFGSATPTFR